MKIRITDEFDVPNIFQAFQIAFVRTAKTKEALAAVLGIRADSWSDKMNNPNNRFYKTLEDFIALLEEAEEYMPLHYIAAELGFDLIKHVEPQPPSTVDDATGRTGLRKP